MSSYGVPHQSIRLPLSGQMEHILDMFGRCICRDSSAKLEILPVSLSSFFLCRLAESTNLAVTVRAWCQLEVPANHYRPGFGLGQSESIRVDGEMRCEIEHKEESPSTSLLPLRQEVDCWVLGQPEVLQADR
jgi:hypothetical protein